MLANHHMNQNSCLATSLSTILMLVDNRSLEERDEEIPQGKEFGSIRLQSELDS